MLLCKSGYMMNFPFIEERNLPHLNKRSFKFSMVSKCANKSGEDNLKRQTTTNSLVHHKITTTTYNYAYYTLQQ